ncbi:MAG: SLC13/DASS family transporter [Flavobacteriales bacterium]|nr:SLC13/DASS family transporter [Flavobacteriales bacterium]
MRLRLLQLAGPLTALLVYWAMHDHGNAPAAMAGIVAWMAVWWISEAVPLAVTSLLPMILFPLFGIDSMAGTAANYGKEIIYLFLGGFLLALAIERTGLHRRIALHIVSLVGSTGPRLVAGIMLASALISMWMNSTSCVLVMLPIALSLLDGDGSPEARRSLTVPLLLAVSYGATIGGMATPVGTPPNLVFLEIWRTTWPERSPIGFGQWMSFGIPFAMIYLGIAWLLITRIVFRVPTHHIIEVAQVEQGLNGMGRMTNAEIKAGMLFALVALFWITGDGISFSDTYRIPGWREKFHLAAVTDGAIAVAAAIFLFLVQAPMPSMENTRKHGPLMTWDIAEQKLPWGILLLFGGGFAIATGMEKTGLANIMVAALNDYSSLHPTALIATVSSVVCVMSELGSNTATASLTLPILAESATVWGMDPQWLLIPATLAATLGFALPVASPMQAIVFGSGRIPVREMVRAGIWMDLIGIVLLTLFFGVMG